MNAEETPLEWVERELARLKDLLGHVIVGVQELPPGLWRDVEVRLGPWDTLNEEVKLDLLDHLLDWSGVDADSRWRITTREVDLRQVPDDPFRQFRRR
ncbi:MAG TPA: hypothetical protein VNK04_00185 [Gemmataceae bacterium]|nr:hypothetical protein [Gemmataceae bacterium]